MTLDKSPDLSGRQLHLWSRVLFEMLINLHLPRWPGKSSLWSGTVVLGLHAGHFPDFSQSPGTCCMGMPSPTFFRATGYPSCLTSPHPHPPPVSSSPKAKVKGWQSPVWWTARTKLCGTPTMCQILVRYELLHFSQ